MSLRWPDLELLRAGRGDLVALSPLSQDAARAAMIDALRRLEPALAVQPDRGPDVAILESLAACVEVMGFYHDRFLTESKLGSAQLIDDLGKIVALIGYRPLPPVAATGYQWFEALAAGLVLAGTRVSGKAAAATVIYETHASIDVAPALNRMAMSPLITRGPGAVRAIVTPHASGLPTDDFRPQTLAQLRDAQGLELAPIASARSRGVAFGRALSRSFEPTAKVSRATVIRRLRGPRKLTSDLVAFEVSTTPILHLPSLAAPELLTSTLEIFVLRPEDEQVDPSAWPVALRYEEKTDFSASEAADLHYRTFVDDALHTWIILRSDLGAQRLLDDDALTRVYARFVPAVGTILDAARTDGTPELKDVTLRLDPSYFETSVVLPPLPGQVLTAQASWAMVDRDLGLGAGDSILIDAGGTQSIRTLIARAAGASPRLLRWADDASAALVAGAILPDAHNVVTGALDPATAKIGALADAANGDVLPIWRELYAQLTPPGTLERTDTDQIPAELPIEPSNPTGSIWRRRVVAAGTTHLVLGDASHITPGDFVLLGQRLTSAVRVLGLNGLWRLRAGELPFDPRTPWLDAEIVQAIEVRGNVVRLATPVSQDYHVHEGFASADVKTPTPLSEVIALPGVVSVPSGDQLRQIISVSTLPSFLGKDNKLYDASYTLATLDRPHTARELRSAFGLAAAAKPAGSLPAPDVKAVQPVVQPAAKPITKWGKVVTPPPAPQPPPPPPTPLEAWDQLFVAVAGVAEPQPSATWSFEIGLGKLRVPRSDLTWLEATDDQGVGTQITDVDLGALATEFAPLRSVTAAAAVASATDHSVLAMLRTPPSWLLSSDPLEANQFAVRDLISFDIHPGEADPGSALLFPAGGTAILRSGEVSLSYAFTWDTAVPHVRDEAPQPTQPFETILSSATPLAQLAAPGAATITADWAVPGARFSDAAFRQLDGGLLVGASADHEQVVTCAFTSDEASFVLHDVAVASSVDPLQRCADVWAVWPGALTISPSAAQAHWVYTLAADDPGALPASALRLALVGTRQLIVDALGRPDGRSASVTPASSADAGDLGFALDTLYGLEPAPVPGAQIAASHIWAWQGITPALADVASSQFIAVVPAHHGHGIETIAWSHAEPWWDAERSTLRLPIPRHRPDVRPADVARLLQVLTPAIDHHRLAIQYDPITARSIVTLAIAPGWPSPDFVPAPVVLARLHSAGVELHETAAPIDVFTTADGHVRWTLYFAGDVRERWTDITIVLRDWSAPGERGLTTTPLWRVPGTPATRAQATGAVTLIVTMRDHDGFLAVPAMPRLVDASADSAVELAPIGPGRVFPAATSVEELSIAIYQRSAQAAPIHLTGTTTLELAALALPSQPVTHVVFSQGTTWHPIPVIGVTERPDGDRQYELGLAYLALFPDGIPREQRIQLCYATSTLAPDAPATLTTLRLRLTHAVAATEGANAVMLQQADGSDAQLVDLPPPRRDGDALTLELGPAGMAALFDANGMTARTALHLALRWQGATLAAAPLRVELGDVPYAIVEGDVFAIDFSDRPTVLGTVRTVEQGVLELAADTSVVTMPSQLRLCGLRTRIAPADYRAKLELIPTSKQPPWLLSFSNAPDTPALLDTLLPWATTQTGDGKQTFTFIAEPTLVEIFKQAAHPLYLFSNEREELRGELYTELDDQVATQLGGAPTINFLTAPDDTTIQELVLASTAWAGQPLPPTPDKGPPTRQIVITTPKCAPTSPRLELAIKAVAAGRLATHTVVQSTRFNTGNFLSFAGLTGSPTTLAALIGSSLRISARPTPRSNEHAADWQPVGYAAPDDLSAAVSALTPGTLAALDGLTYARAVRLGLASSSGVPPYAFSASFSSLGVCTLHFLFVDTKLIDSVDVRIETQYEVSRAQIRGAASGALYPLETPAVTFDPATQLALLAPSQLRPGALLFVHHDVPDDVPALQWTTVKRVTGSIVEVSPPIAYATDALEPNAVTMLGRLQNPAQLDAGYYQTLAKAKLVPASGAAVSSNAPTFLLPLHDRLPLDVISGSVPSLLTTLLPGDRVLVFDERQRLAWSQRRQGVPGDAGWETWPDVQHEAVVKEVDADTGLLVLAAPLPDSVQIGWTLHADGRLIPDREDLAALRVLPHYRAPVHGPRTLSVLGSGNRGHRFARFQAAIDAAAGNAVIPLAADGVTSGNLEVIAFDPEKAAWSRWLRFDKLSRAGKKDPAFTLGFRPQGATGTRNVNITFGDGQTGQLLPTGTRNVYLRTTQIVPPSPPGEVHIVSRVDEVTTTSVPRPCNVRLRLACTAPDELLGGSDRGAAQWQSTLAISLDLGTEIVTLPEITRADAIAGASGFLFVAEPDMPPGVVDAYLYTDRNVSPTDKATVTLRPARTWTLDGKFYGPSLLELTATAGASTVQLLETTGLGPGSLLALYPDDASLPDIAHLTSIDPPTWSAVVSAPLPRIYDAERSFIRGNIAPIVQGSVEDTTLGSSDGETPSLRLPLQNRAPLLYVDLPGHEPEPDITVFVADLPWKRVLDFTNKTPADRVWRLDHEPDGTSFLVFGDGKHGAIPPAGRDNIAVRMRLGTGAAGNLTTGAINKLVSGNLAVKSTTNVRPAAGGSAGDLPAQAREKAFAHKLPSDRVVSAGDCVRVALGISGVISAALDPSADPSTLRVVVAMDDRHTPTHDDLAAIASELHDEMPVTARVRLQVVPAVQAAVHLVIELGVTDDQPADAVFAAVTAAFAADGAGFFAPDRWDIGEPLRLGTIYDALLGVPGVATARVVWLAAIPLADGVKPSGPAPDAFDPGATGVVRCDNDRLLDPLGLAGTFRLEPAPEATS